MTSASAPGWPLLVAASVRALDWTGVLGAAGLALGAATLVTVLPDQADAVLGTATVLVLACGLAAVLDDDTAGTTAPVPTSVRRRLMARAAIAVPVLAAGLAGVVALVAGVGTGSERELALSWLVLGALAVAVAGPVLRGPVDLPGPAAAAVVLAPASVLLPLLPAPVLTVPLWDSTGERVAIVLLVSAALLAWATRDPAA